MAPWPANDGMVAMALGAHGPWVVFVGTLFFGESVVLAAAALAASGSWSLTAVAGFAFAGTVVADTAWFVSASRSLGWWTADEDRAVRLARATRRLDHLVGERPHRALLFVKFLYGTRIASLAYTAARRVPTRRFLAFDAAGTLLWLAVLLPIGWVAGDRLAALGADLRHLEVWLAVGLAAALMTKGAVTWHRTRRR